MSEDKDKRKQKKKKNKQNEYEAFISNYGKEVPPQAAKQALYDFQMKDSLRTPFLIVRMFLFLKREIL